MESNIVKNNYNIDDIAFKFYSIVKTLVDDEKYLNDKFINAVAHTIKMLKKCKFNKEEIIVCLSYTFIYLQRLLLVFEPTECNELMYITLLIFFIAHCYVLDEACTLKTWQKNVFFSYATLSQLNKAVIQIIKTISYRLQVEEEVILEIMHKLSENNDLHLG